MAIHDGHRERLRKKMDQNALEDHEWLEALLFNAIPRRNTNDIAHRLLASFGSIPGVFSATYEQLKQVDGIGDHVASYLKCFEHFLNSYYGLERKIGRFDPVTFREDILSDYQHERVEVLDFYFFNAKREFIYRQRYSCNNMELVDVDPSWISEAIVRFKSRGVSNVVMVHNHLAGSCEPSDYDVEATSQIQVLMNLNNILLLDHFICSPMGIYSFYDSGEMLRINQAFSVSNILKNSGVISR